MEHRLEHGKNKIIIAYTDDDDVLYISREWAKQAGIKTIKIAEGVFGKEEHRI